MSLGLLFQETIVLKKGLFWYLEHLWTGKLKEPLLEFLVGPVDNCFT